MGCRRSSGAEGQVVQGVLGSRGAESQVMQDLRGSRGVNGAKV